MIHRTLTVCAVVIAATPAAFAVLPPNDYTAVQLQGFVPTPWAVDDAGNLYGHDGMPWGIPGYWDVTGEFHPLSDRTDGAIRSVTPDGTTAVGWLGSDAIVFDIQTGTTTTLPALPGTSFSRASDLADDGWPVIGWNDGTPVVWDDADHEPRAMQHVGIALARSLNSDGTTAVGVDNNRPVRWDIETGAVAVLNRVDVEQYGDAWYISDSGVTCGTADFGGFLTWGKRVYQWPADSMVYCVSNQAAYATINGQAVRLTYTSVMPLAGLVHDDSLPADVALLYPLAVNQTSVISVIAKGPNNEQLAFALIPK